MVVHKVKQLLLKLATVDIVVFKFQTDKGFVLLQACNEEVQTQVEIVHAEI